MRCIGCGFETEDVTEFLVHGIDCAGKPEEKWQLYLDEGTAPMPFKNSEILKEDEK